MLPVPRTVIVGVPLEVVRVPVALISPPATVVSALIVRLALVLMTISCAIAFVAVPSVAVAEFPSWKSPPVPWVVTLPPGVYVLLS